MEGELSELRLEVLEEGVVGVVEGGEELGEMGSSYLHRYLFMHDNITRRI